MEQREIRNISRSVKCLHRQASWLEKITQNLAEKVERIFPHDEQAPSVFRDSMYIYPDFYSWASQAIRTKSGLIVAPSDFYVIDRRNGHTKHLFTREEMCRFEKMLNNHGWRYPTAKEWREIWHNFDSLDEMLSKLNLSFCGWVPPYMVDEYNQTLSDDAIELDGMVGAYWSGTDLPNGECSDHFAFTAGKDYAGVAYNDTHYAEAIRCVRI